MNFFWAGFSFLIFSLVGGEPLFCQSGSTLSEDGLTCECMDSTLFYSAFHGKCLSVCGYYGDALCDGNGFSCSDDSTSTTGFTCDCPIGFEVDNATCIDANLCRNNVTIICGANEICVNLPDGGDKCGCDSNNGYYRSQNGVCEAIDYCLNYKLNICDQLCLTNVDGKPTCDCIDGYTVGSSANRCVLVDGYVPCECGSNPKFAICAELNGTKTCEPKQGYARVNGSAEEMEDINECETGNYQCPEYSSCSNKIGYYTCDCNSGFEHDLLLLECVPRTCLSGEVLLGDTCVDPCSPSTGFWCPPNAICMVDEINNPMCRCQLSCQVNGWAPLSNFSIYRANFELPNQNSLLLSQQEEFMITRSMEYLFGLGNAELMMYTREVKGSSIQIDIGVSQPVMNISVLEAIIRDSCRPLKENSSECILPGGTIINAETFYVEQNFPCEDDLCSLINAQCMDNGTDIMPGIFQCSCWEGYEAVESSYGMYCEDIDECLDELICSNVSVCVDEYTCSNGTMCINTAGSYYCQERSSDVQSIIEIYTFNITELQMEIDQLNSDLQDQKRKTAIIGGVLGAFLGLVIIAYIIGAICLSKSKSKANKSHNFGQ